MPVARQGEHVNIAIDMQASGHVTYDQANVEPGPSSLNPDSYTPC